jgi:hypothetical protein
MNQSLLKHRPFRLDDREYGKNTRTSVTARRLALSVLRMDDQPRSPPSIIL